jgi:hypothetical protein
MEEKEPNKKSLVRIKPELLVALIAVLISFLTLFVYLYQSNLMKTQQKMSAWPHLTFGPSWGHDYIIINLMNKGIGPAIIKKVRISIDNEPLDGIHEIMHFFPDSLVSEFTYSGLWEGQVVMAGENIQLFKNNNAKTVKYFLDMVQANRIEFEICYCSVYEDCWISSGMEVKASKCK